MYKKKIKKFTLSKIKIELRISTKQLSHDWTTPLPLKNNNIFLGMPLIVSYPVNVRSVT